MNLLAFLRSPEATRLLERAARCAAMPVSVHYLDRGNESPRIRSWGQCQACRYVQQTPEGMQACRNSRMPAAGAAVQRDKPTPFLCHMGFACVSMPVFAESGRAYVLTFGPYVPADAAQSLERDALSGLHRLGIETTAGLPFPLSDIRPSSAAGVPELAAWTAEALQSCWEALGPPDTELPEEAAETPDAAKKRRVRNAVQDPYQSAAIAAALAGGRQTPARRLAQSVLVEARAAQQTKAVVKRGRAVALVASVLEACDRAQADTTAAWEALPAFIHEVRQARTDADILNRTMTLLGAVRRSAQRDADAQSGLMELNRVLHSQLAEGITLAAVAAQLGQTPPAITHRLQRKFGLSFSQYLARLRIDRAKELLRRTQLPVNVVAQRVGISDVANFGKLFRRFEGVAPSTYRERHKSTS